MQLTVCSIASDYLFDLEYYHHEMGVNIPFKRIQIDIHLEVLSFFSQSEMAGLYNLRFIQSKVKGLDIVLVI